MSIFGLRKSNVRYGAVVDIGSGSVLVSIIKSDPNKSYPEIIWSHREHAPLKNIDSLEQSAKAVMTALVNASMMLDSEGRRELNNYVNTAELSELQFSISAPWSYTVTKNIIYTQEKDFDITETLIEELLDAVESKVEGELNDSETLKTLGLQIIANCQMSLSANGYQIANPENNTANTLSISQSSAVAQEYLIDAITELQQKLFTRSKTTKLSFILMFFSVVRESLTKQNNICLVDVTYEATEIGIVRDGVLTYCTHTPYGSFSLAREISNITGVPLTESFGYLHTDRPFSFLENLNKKQVLEIEKLIENYTQRISDLFKETGDSLSIPKKILIHSDLKSEPFFSGIVHKAGTRVLKSPPQISLITTEIIKKFYTAQTDGAKITIPVDTALLLSAQFFHNKNQYVNYKYF